jgi:hypothetical protein
MVAVAMISIYQTHFILLLATLEDFVGHCPIVVAELILASGMRVKVMCISFEVGHQLSYITLHVPFLP